MLGPLQTRFWRSADGDSSENEEDEASAVYTDVRAAGYSEEEARQAAGLVQVSESHLFAGHCSSAGGEALSMSAGMLLSPVAGGQKELSTGGRKKQLTGVPWQGPLPPPRSSPELSFGDALARAVFRLPAVSTKHRSKLCPPISMAALSKPKIERQFLCLNHVGSKPEIPQIALPEINVQPRWPIKPVIPPIKRACAHLWRRDPIIVQDRISDRSSTPDQRTYVEALLRPSVPMGRGGGAFGRSFVGSGDGRCGNFRGGRSSFGRGRWNPGRGSYGGNASVATSGVIVGNAGVGRGLPQTGGFADFNNQSGTNAGHLGPASGTALQGAVVNHGQGVSAQSSTRGFDTHGAGEQIGAGRMVVDGTMGMSSASSAGRLDSGQIGAGRMVLDGAAAVAGPGSSTQLVLPKQSGRSSDSHNVQPVKDSGADKFKRFCFRCKEKGHTIAACPVVLHCDICDNTNHLAPRCPLLKMPKPVANFCGYGAEGLGFYMVPSAGPSRPRDEQGTMGVVRIVGGQISVDRVIGELRRLIPIDWQWDVKEIGQNSFLVQFPTPTELARMVQIGDIQVKSQGVVLRFEEWKPGPTPKFQLHSVWVQVSGVPYEVRDYLSLCAIGSIVGATLKVDMISTRKKDLVRLQVGVIDVSLIPTSVDIVVGHNVYELFFKVEQDLDGHMGQDNVGDEQNNGGGQDKEGDKDEDMKDREMMDRDAKRAKNSVARTGPNSSGTTSSPQASDPVLGNSLVCVVPFSQQDVVKESLGGPKIAEVKVPALEGAMVLWQPVVPVERALPAGEADVEADSSEAATPQSREVKLSLGGPEGAILPLVDKPKNGGSVGAAEKMPRERSTGTPLSDALEWTVVQKKGRSAGAVAHEGGTAGMVSEQEPRWSRRLANKVGADEDSLVKAVRRAKYKNLEESKGHIQMHPLDPILVSFAMPRETGCLGSWEQSIGGHYKGDLQQEWVEAM